MLLNNQKDTEEIIGNKKYLRTNKNGNTSIQNLWDTAKAILRGKFISIQVYFRKKYPQKSQINYLTLHLKEPEKEEQTKPKVIEGR